MYVALCVCVLHVCACELTPSLMQEKAMGSTPSDMMDRDRAFIPELQLGFLNGIAEPVYKSVPV